MSRTRPLGFPGRTGEEHLPAGGDRDLDRSEYQVLRAIVLDRDGRAVRTRQLGDRLADIAVGVDDLRDGHPAREQFLTEVPRERLSPAQGPEPFAALPSRLDQ